MSVNSLDNVIVADGMLMLKRKAYERIATWKSSPSKKALLVTGARQIGKTFLVRQFGQENYDNVIEFNFILNAEAKSVFSAPSTPEEILMALSLLSGKKMVPGKTLIFLDEIQEAPEAVTAIKGLVEDGRYDFILSGSLLGVELRNIRANPVGYISTLTMYPLDFEEFCWARNVQKDIFEYVNTCLHAKKQVAEPIHKQMTTLFRQYMVVGGMPDAVNTFCETENLALVRQSQEAIKDWYRIDISKYCPDSEKLKAKEAFDLVSSELNNPNKRFILKQLNENARFRNYEEAFLWLAYANVALPAYNVTEPASPLLISKERNLFKLFYSDTGILTSAYSEKAALSLLSGSQEVNHGSTFENAVAQELVAHGFNLYYFNSKKLGEVDFVVETRDGKVIPIEVKSGKSYKRHSAISNVLKVENYHLDHAVVLATGNVECNGRLFYLPVYMIALFDNK